MFADARHRLEQGVVTRGGGLGELLELRLQRGELGVVMADERQIVLQGQLADRMVLLRQQFSSQGSRLGRVWRRVGRLWAS